MNLNGKVKIVFFDFDWTLFDHRTYEIKPSALKAINLLKNNGIKIVINTGRSYYSLLEKDIVKEIKPDALVVANGGAALVDNQILYAHYFDEKEQNDLLNFLDKNKYSYGIITLYTTYGKTFERGNVDKFFNSFDEPRSKDIKEYKNEKILSVTAFVNDDEAENIKNNFKSFNFSNFFGPCIEIRKKEFLKQEGVRAILNHFGFKKDEAIAFGDDTNDIDMFNEVKYSVAVGNAKNELKNVATFVTKDIDDDGIFYILKKLNLI
ncbi:MAG: Cof-type HAD-IIB family hydrolase, partial [bacterium]|nr:Cof-type HAD-IIB family hydrolase [bacterium]